MLSILFLSRDLLLADFKSVPSEVAELASMSMELISMDAWDEFYDSEEELKRAKKEQMQKVLEGLPWIAAIDRFQQWIYTTPHTADERRDEWSKIMSCLSSSLVNWVGHEKAVKTYGNDNCICTKCLFITLNMVWYTIQGNRYGEVTTIRKCCFR